MRNNTKLKHLLLKYTVSFDMDDDGIFKLTLLDKLNHNIQQFEGSSYGIVLSKAYKYLSQELKMELT